MIMADMDPTIGNWYHEAGSARHFEVLNVDEDDGLVEIRFDDGDNAHFLLDAWYEMDLEPGTQPHGSTRRGDEAGAGRRGRDERLSDEAFRRATQWGERSPDDFDERGHDA